MRAAPFVPVLSHRLCLAVIGLSAATALAGCVAQNPAEGSIVFYAAWGVWPADPHPHLFVTINNDGGDVVEVGPGGRELRVLGPTGTVPVLWGATEWARPIEPGQTVTVAFHPRTYDAFTFALSIDHDAGTPSPPPVGFYEVCVGSVCAEAELKPTS